ncbi:putative calcium-binding protein CML30 [Abeliophyllum distichum]|uniref:Calcium-binding protein CML30 n=1 Tax=Abeliophyllum distichum TaxID=126358 RepID=A0ABD1RX05_9LAMI
MNSKISVSGVICICGAVASVVEFISIILWCMFFSFIFTFKDLYLCFSGLFKTIFRPLFSIQAHGNTVHHKVSTVRGCCTSNETVISARDVEIVVNKLGLVFDPKEAIGAGEILSVFEENEVCLELLKEAFNVFDQNNDGYIVANELNKVLNSLGLTQFSDEECWRMIVAMDCDGDGRIDFDEFVRLMDSSC